MRSIAALDRTKEPGSVGEPLYLDVIAALSEAKQEGDASPGVIGGRYGLSSKEFTPAMVKTVFDELGKQAPKPHFTVGITDDVTHLSLDVDDSFDIEGDDVQRSIFFGLGADGTVGANKNSIKIIGEETDNYAQGYFCLRLEEVRRHDNLPPAIRTESDPLSLSDQAGPICRLPPVGLHRQVRCPRLCRAGGRLPAQLPLRSRTRFGTACPRGARSNHREEPEVLCDRRLRWWLARAGMGTRVNTIMQTCFFAISGVLPRDEAIEKIKATIRKTYGEEGRRTGQTQLRRRRRRAGAPPRSGAYLRK